MLDATIIVAVFAFGLASLRVATDLLRGRYHVMKSGVVHFGLVDLAGVAYALALVFMLGLIILRLIPPRPSRRRLASQPGIAACLGSWAGCAIVVGSWTRRLLSHQGWGAAPRWARGSVSIAFESYVFLSELSLLVPAGIVAAWLMIWLGGRMRRPIDWIDRCGVILGLCCLGVYLFTIVWQFFEP